MEQQTAVEWLVEQLIELEYDLRLIPNHIKQAKEMDKQQKMDAYGVGHNEGCSYMIDGKTEFKNSEQYYNETYGGGESNVLGEVECYFIPSTNTSSGTICRNCGQEMFLHTFGEGIKVSTSPNPQNK